MVVAFGSLIAMYNVLVAIDFFSLGKPLRLQILYGTQAFVLFVISAVLCFGWRPKPTRETRGSQAVEQFWFYWPFLWCSWTVLYAVLFLSRFCGAEAWWVQVILHGLNNVSTLVLIMLFHVLSAPTLPESASEGDILADYIPKNEAPSKPIQEEAPAGDEPLPKRNLEMEGRHIAKFVFWLMFLVVITIIEAGLIWAAGAGIITGDSPDNILKVFGIAYGILAATATALLVSQFDAKIFGVPIAATAVLFVFAAIQPTFEFILGTNATDWLFATQALLIVVALVSKAVLFGMVQWLAYTGRLLYYMVEAYSLDLGLRIHRQEKLRNFREHGSLGKASEKRRSTETDAEGDTRSLMVLFVESKK